MEYIVKFALTLTIHINFKISTHSVVVAFNTYLALYCNIARLRRFLNPITNYVYTCLQQRKPVYPRPSHTSFFIYLSYNDIRKGMHSIRKALESLQKGFEL